MERALEFQVDLSQTLPLRMQADHFLLFALQVPAEALQLLLLTPNIPLETVQPLE